MTEQETPRQRAARLRLDGLPMSEIALELGLTRQCIHNWTRDDLITIAINLPKDQAKTLAERYQHEKHEDPVTGEPESLTAYLRRLWIGETA